MKIFKIQITDPDPEIIKRAQDVIESGGLLVYPTDTAYGLGVNAYDNKALHKLYRSMNRKENKPTHVVVKDWDMIAKLTKVNKSARILYEKFMPGPLTLILPKKDNSKLPDILTGGLSTLGVRMPHFEVTQSLSKLLKIPYTTPSANRSDEPTPYSVDDVEKHLDLKDVDMILDAGPLPHNKPSTLVDLSEKTVKILREGEITSRQIFKTL